MKKIPIVRSFWKSYISKAKLSSNNILKNQKDLELQHYLKLQILNIAEPNFHFNYKMFNSFPILKKKI